MFRRVRYAHCERSQYEDFMFRVTLIFVALALPILIADGAGARPTRPPIASSNDRFS